MPKFIVNTEATVVRGFIVHAPDWERAKRIIETRFVDDDLPADEDWLEDDQYDTDQEVITAVMSTDNGKVTFHYDRDGEVTPTVQELTVDDHHFIIVRKDADNG